MVGLVSNNCTTKQDVRNEPNLSAVNGLVQLRYGFHLTQLQNYAQTQYVCSLESLFIFLTTNYSQTQPFGITVILSYLMHESGRNTVYGFSDGFHTFLKHYAQYTAMELWQSMGKFPATGLLLVEP